MVTPKGLPIVTLDKEQFDLIAASLSDNLHLPASWLKDVASYTATETIGAAIAAVSVAFGWKSPEIERFAQLLGSFGVSTIAAAKPLLGVVSVICLAEAARRVWSGEAEMSDLALGVGKGTAGSLAFLLGSGAVASVGAPSILGLFIGVTAGVAAHRGVTAIQDANWNELVEYLQSWPNLISPNRTSKDISSTAI